MSVLTLQVGQCGNQLGLELFTQLADAARVCTEREQELVSHRFFREPAGASDAPVARAVLADMEPKVVEKCLVSAKKGKAFSYGRQRVLTRDEGSANNWAYGYHVQALQCMPDILEQSRKEVERMSAIEGVLMLHSVAGGTGSGVGSRLVEHMKDELPNVPLVSIPVLPLDSGEVALQHYNTLLSLSSLFHCCDLVLPFANTDTVHMCQGPLGVNNPTLDDLNRVIAHDAVAGALFPAYSASPGPGLFGGQVELPLRPLSDLCSIVAPIPTRKLGTVATAPRAAQNRAQRFFEAPTLNQCVQELRRAAPMDGGPSLLTIRGSVQMPAQSRHSPVVDFGPLCTTARSSCIKGGTGAGVVSVCANSPRPVKTLTRLVRRCREMLSGAAYVHHYNKHGVETADFAEGIACLEQTVKDYGKGW
eukprot:TRINITY_DN12373_c0_g1_i1.p1 TRINITY_DN12373_c0_g1~~TRINITY_DN12373_c0_g1_i1.p1  ORF type:complete len:419 (+),score=48.23 TRINITY_DN12373_c0_g1_i1:84-1340(+)